MEKNLIHDFNEASKIGCTSYRDEKTFADHLKLISTNFNFDYAVDSIEGNSFLSNLYRILVQSSNQSDLAWVAIETIESMSKTTRRKEWIRKLSVEFKFSTILSKLLLGLEDEKKILRLLNLINILTSEKSTENFIENPYLEVLITKLVNYFLNNELDGNPIAKLSLSILVNVCNKKDDATNILIRRISPSEFANKAKNYGILAYKIFIILEGLYTSKPKDIVHYLKLIMHNIMEAVESGDTFILEQCTESLQDLLEIDNISEKVECNDIGKDVTDLMKFLTAKIKENAKHDSGYKNVVNCLKFLLQLDLELSQFFTDFLEIYINEVVSGEIVGYSEILDFLSTFFEAELNADIDVLLNLILDQLIPQILSNFLDNQISLEEEVLFLKFLSPLILNPKLTPSIGKITQLINIQFFDKIFEDLSDTSEEKLNKYITALKTLNDFSCVSPKEFYARLDDTLKMDGMVMVLAKGQLSGDKNRLIAIFTLMKMPEFPVKKVAETVLKFRNIKCMNTVESASGSSNLNVSKTHQINKILLENSEETIQRINKKIDSGLVKINPSEIMDLYKHKIKFAQDTVELLNESLKKYSEDNIQLTQKIVYLNSILNKQETTQFQLQLTNERLNGEILKMEATETALKNSISNFQKKIEKGEKRSLSLQKSVELRELENHELKRQHEESLKAYNEKLKKLEKQRDENVGRIEEMKQSLKDYEMSVKETSKKIALYEEEEKNLKTKNVALEKEFSKLSKLLSIKEQELEKKMQLIEQLESDLKESESIKEGILNLMNGSKRARK